MDLANPAAHEWSGVTIAPGTDEHNRVVREPAGDERENFVRRLIEPLDVVGDDEKGLILSSVDQQCQRRHRYEKRFRCCGLGRAKRHLVRRVAGRPGAT